MNTPSRPTRQAAADSRERRAAAPTVAPRRPATRRAAFALSLAAPLAALAACQDGPLATAPAATARGVAAEPPDTRKSPLSLAACNQGCLAPLDRILYIHGHSASGITYGVHAMNADGSADVQLTSGVVATNPQWSPDYKRIAFGTGESAGPSGIYVMNADGTGLKRIAAMGNNSDMRDVSWSPDGTRLVFTAVTPINGTGAAEIFMINADGSQLQRLTFEPSDERDPVFSKDGKRIVFASSRQNPAGTLDLWSVALDGSQVLRLTQTPENETDPAFSPDGTQLAWAKGYPSPALMVGNAFALRPRLAKTGMVHSPTWSHDGKFIAYGAYHAGGAEPVVEKIELWSGKPAVLVSKPGVKAYSPNWAY